MLHLALTSLPFSASVPMVEELQKRIAELTAELGEQGPALAAAQREKARLEEVEANLCRTVQSLRADLLASQKKHSDELLAVTASHDELRAERDAAVTARDALQTERDEARTACDGLMKSLDDQAAKVEELETRHQEEANRLRRRAKGFCDSLEEMDTLLSGK